MAKPYFILLTFSGLPSKSLNDQIESVAGPVKALMVGSGFAVLGVSWDSSSAALWGRITKTKALINVKEMLILEAGTDFSCAMDKPAHGWLTRHAAETR